MSSVQPPESFSTDRLGSVLGSTSSLSWLREVRCLRAIAILGVIAIHTTAYFAYISQVNTLVVVENGLDVVSQVSVPLFVLASGLALSFRYRDSFSRLNFYRKRLATVVPPYLAFSGFYAAYTWWTSGNAPLLRPLLWEFLLGTTFYHLWFIPLIVQLYLLFPFLVKISDRCSGRRRLWIPAIAMGLQVSYNVVVLPSGLVASSQLASIIASRFFVGYLGYFVAGMYFGRHLDSVRTRIGSLPLVPFIGVAIVAAGIISAVWLQGIQQYGNYYNVPAAYLVPAMVLEPILYFSVFVVIFRWAMGARSQVVGIFGDYSLWVYLVHPIFIILMVDFLRSVGIGYESWAFYPIVFVSTCGLCLLSTFLLSKIPNNRIVGGPRGSGTAKGPRTFAPDPQQRTHAETSRKREPIPRRDGLANGSLVRADGGSRPGSNRTALPQSGGAFPAEQLSTGRSEPDWDRESEERSEGL